MNVSLHFFTCSEKKKDTRTVAQEGETEVPHEYSSLIKHRDRIPYIFRLFI